MIRVTVSERTRLLGWSEWSAVFRFSSCGLTTQFRRVEDPAVHRQLHLLSLTDADLVVAVAEAGSVGDV